MDWRDRAACKGKPPEWWFDHWSYHLARRVCAVCPVRSACAEEGILNGEHGMWGGLSENERLEVPGRERRYVCEVCGVEMLQAPGPPRRFCEPCYTERRREQQRRDNRTRKREAWRETAPEVRLGWEEKVAAARRARRRILEDA